MRKPLEILVFSARAPVALKERFPEKGTVSLNPSKNPTQERPSPNQERTSPGVTVFLQAAEIQ